MFCTNRRMVSNRQRIQHYPNIQFIQTNHILFIKHCFITFHYWHGIIYRHHQNAMPIIFKRYWFLTPYVFLLFLHPFLNYVLNACSKKQIRFLCISLFIAVSVIPTIFIVTDPFGFNIFRFILLYLIAYAIKKNAFESNSKTTY